MEEMVTVTHPVIGDLVLTASHAKRLLGMKNNGGWVLKKPAAQPVSDQPHGIKGDKEQGGKSWGEK